MSIRWLSSANKDMEKIIDWYNQDSPGDLQTVARGIWETAQSLARLPNRGRKGEVEGTREILVAKLPYWWFTKSWIKILQFCESCISTRIGRRFLSAEAS